ncbi:unnamed protein product [Lampetra fluviatilis]
MHVWPSLCPCGLGLAPGWLYHSPRRAGGGGGGGGGDLLSISRYVWRLMERSVERELGSHMQHQQQQQPQQPQHQQQQQQQQQQQGSYSQGFLRSARDCLIFLFCCWCCKEIID